MDKFGLDLVDKSTGGASLAPQPEGEKSSLSEGLSLYSAYSWRGRIGLIAPSTNTTLESEFARMTPDGIYRLALSQLPTLSVIDSLERLLRKPVITSNQATCWRCLRAVNFTDSIAGFGRLLAENPAP